MRCPFFFMRTVSKSSMLLPDCTLRKDLLDLVVTIRWSEDRDVLPDHLLGRVAVDPLGARVPGLDDGVEGGAEDGVMGRVDDGGEPMPDVFVQPPCEDARDARARYEESVDPGPLPGICASRVVVEDRVGVQRAADPVVDHHICDRQQERDPVLVERQDHDHHEEVEVSLDVAPREVDEQRRRGEESERDESGPRLAGQVRQAGQQGRSGNQGTLEDAVTDPVSLGQGKDRQGDRVSPKEGKNAAVPSPPDVVRQGLPPRQRELDPADCSSWEPHRLGLWRVIGTSSFDLNREALG